MVSFESLVSSDIVSAVADIVSVARGRFAAGNRIKLLQNNQKMRKVPGVSGRGWIIKGIAMAPADVAGREACTWRSRGCTRACNGLFSGGNNMPNSRRAMIERKIFFFERRSEFMSQLREELRDFERSATRAGLRPALRANVSSDIVWERIAPELFEEFPGISWYDYTKASFRHRPELPSNYALSHSVSERSKYADVVEAIGNGRNIVCAFNSSYVWGKYVNAKGYLPRQLRIVDREGYRPTIVVDCVNGDRHDLRLPIADGRGRCVALRGKGGRKVVAQGVADGFILDFPAGRKLRNVDRLQGEAILVC